MSIPCIEYIDMERRQERIKNAASTIRRMYRKREEYNYLSRTDKNTISLYKDIAYGLDIRSLPDEVVILIIEYVIPSSGDGIIQLSLTCKFFRYVLFSLDVENHDQYYTLPRIHFLQSYHSLYNRSHIETIEITSSEIYDLKDTRLSCDTLVLQYDHDYISDESSEDYDSYDEDSSESDRNIISPYVENISFSTLILKDISYKCFPISSLREKYPRIQYLITNNISSDLLHTLTEKYPHCIDTMGNNTIIAITQEICDTFNL